MAVITVSSPCPTNLSFWLCLKMQKNFNIELEEERDLNITASEPIFFFYKFGEDVSSVVLEIESFDDKCMTLSIQNKSCPVYDIEQTVEYRGSWETITTKGSIMLMGKHYPEGFYVVLNVHGDDSDCNSSVIDTGEFMSNDTHRIKVLKLKLNKTLSSFEFWTASSSLLGLFVVSYLVVIIICYHVRVKRKPEVNENARSSTEEGSTSTAEEGTSTEEEDTSTASLESNDHTILVVKETVKPSERDGAERVHEDPDSHVQTNKLYLSDLATKPPKVLEARSNLFFSNVLTIGIFYLLPVFQLVWTHQKMLNTSGDHDICFYNFLCSHQFMVVSDFNHIFSNISYAFFGVLFIGLTCRKQKASNINSGKGIPHHFGLYHAMGLALIMEGLLSACYHVCPNHSNIQFDTTFMYIIAMLCVLKLYQSRHPDINARAAIVCVVFAFVLFLGMWGVLWPSVSFYITFDVLHLGACVYLSLQVYFLGEWQLVYRDREACAKLRAKPNFCARLRLLIFGNLVNVGLAIRLVWSNTKDFSEHLLAIFLINATIYLFFYMRMKCANGEKLTRQTLLYMLLAVVCWGFAVRYYTNHTMCWLGTAAESRTYNAPCKIERFYDSHDLWHFLSAAAVFFSYMALLTLDNDLEDTKRTHIAVF